jgi:hypothetical protein
VPSANRRETLSQFHWHFQLLKSSRSKGRKPVFYKSASCFLDAVCRANTCYAMAKPMPNIYGRARYYTSYRNISRRFAARYDTGLISGSSFMFDHRF